MDLTPASVQPVDEFSDAELAVLRATFAGWNFQPYQQYAPDDLLAANSLIVKDYEAEYLTDPFGIAGVGASVGIAYNPSGDDPTAATGLHWISVIDDNYGVGATQLTVDTDPSNPAISPFYDYGYSASPQGFYDEPYGTDGGSYNYTFFATVLVAQQVASQDGRPTVVLWQGFQYGFQASTSPDLTAANINIATPENTSITVDALHQNFIPPAYNTATVISAGEVVDDGATDEGGTATVTDANTSINYQPPANFTGMDSFPYVMETQDESIFDGTVNVTVFPSTHFSVSAPTTVVAGTPFSFTVTALTASNTTATWYNGSAYFASSDTNGVLPHTPLTTSLTSGVGTFSATFTTAGSQVLDASYPGYWSVNTQGSCTITVTPSSVKKIGITVASGAALVDGVKAIVTFTVAAEDQYNNVVAGYNGNVEFASSDPFATLPGQEGLNNGLGTFSATLETLGSRALSATDTVNDSLTGTTHIIVGLLPATHLVIVAPATVVAGLIFDMTVTARDTDSDVADAYTGTVAFSGSDPLGTLPSSLYALTLTEGVGTFSAILITAGNRLVTASDVWNTNVSAGNATIFVVPAPAVLFRFITAGATGTGTPFPLTVTALDLWNNTATAYTGSVHFTSSDPSATLPATATLASGVGVFSATLHSSGTRTITATDTVTGTITGSVDADAATHLEIEGVPGTTTAGTEIDFTVIALDAFGGTATGYTGTIAFSSNNGLALLPGNAELTAGFGIFSATLCGAGSSSLTATDINNGSISTSAAVTVVPGAVVKFGIWVSSTSIEAGTEIACYVTAQDLYGNTVTSDNATAYLASTDSQAVVPAGITLVSGVGGFSTTLYTAGGQAIIAWQGTATSTSDSISVTALGATELIIPNAPGVLYWDENCLVTIEAVDQYGNVCTSYSGTVTWCDSNDYNSGSDYISNGSVVTSIFLYPNERGEDDEGNLTIFVTSGSLTASFTFTPTWPIE